MALSTIHRPCDVCFIRGGRYVESVHVDVKVKINQERGRLDLCQPHYEQLLMPVIEALRDRKEDDLNTHRNHSRKIGPFRCQIPDCPTPMLKHANSFEQHVQRVHQITLREYLDAHGELVPLTPEQVAQIVVEVRCEVPGCGQVYSTELGNRWPLGALNSHLRGRHGLKPDMTPIR